MRIFIEKFAFIENTTIFTVLTKIEIPRKNINIRINVYYVLYALFLMLKL